MKINNSAFYDKKNRITSLFGIEYPIIQGGMIWCSNHELVAAVSNAGGLGLLGAGSMSPNELREEIRKTKNLCLKPFGVNVPLLYMHSEEVMNIIVEEGVKIVFTSAGNPRTWTSFLQEKGIKVAHVVSNSKFAKKADEAGVDAIVAEGFEAGGHNGFEETTTLTLIPAVRRITEKPLISAGGIATGKAMLAVMALGAEGVQMGTRFVASIESSAHENFKEEIVKAKEGDTDLLLKKIVPVRLLKNKFSREIKVAENDGKSREDLSELLGRGRARKGMKEGDIENGELEVGQVSVLIKKIKPIQAIIDEIITEYRDAKQLLTVNSLDI